MMKNPFRLAFKDNISAIEESSRLLVKSPSIPLNLPEFTLEIPAIAPGLLAAIQILGAEGATEEDLSNLVMETDGMAKLPIFYYYLQKFTECGIIKHILVSDGRLLAAMVPLSPDDKFEIKEATPEQKYVMSRFAYSRKDGDRTVLESPLSHEQVILSDWRGAALLAELANPQNSLTLTAIPGISQEAALNFLSLLLSAEMVSEVAENGIIGESENVTLSQWEFHDLLFHSRSRTGRHDNKTGKTYRFLGKIPPLPVVKSKGSDEAIALYQPDIEKLAQEDSPFSRVLEARKSIRGYGDAPITDKQLGEFLYRSARIKKIFPKDYGESSDRPYASGGACYELELYLAVNTCENIASGFYRYCPKDHLLYKISGRTTGVETLLESASLATGRECVPQVLITFAARFQRVSWNYQTMAYATILKDVGSLQQTMYLVATAMNLAPCALGCGNADLFAKTAETDYYAEASVGEFILGSKSVD